MENDNNVVPIQAGGSIAPIDMTNGIFSSVSSFEAGQRMARALAASDLVPTAYHGNIANCAIALDMAMRMKLSPMTVLQALNVIQGRPAWSAQFIISAINSSGLFTPLRFEWKSDEGSDAWGCRAWATDPNGDRCDGPWVSIDMAKKEGWYGRSGSKWQTMPELMLRYRAGAFFGRLYAGHILAGMTLTTEEVIDMGDAVVVTDNSQHARKSISAATTLEDRAKSKGAKRRKASESSPETPPDDSVTIDDTSASTSDEKPPHVDSDVPDAEPTGPGFF